MVVVADVRSFFIVSIKSDGISTSQLHGLIGLGAEVGCGRTGLAEKAAEDWLDEATEDNLSTTITQRSVDSTSRCDQVHTQSGEEPSREREQT